MSINTIGSALEMLAREGLITKKQGSGITVADRVNRLKNVGILSEIDLFDSRGGPFLRAVAGKLKRLLEKAGVSAKLYVGHADSVGDGIQREPTCPQFWDDITAGRLDGGVILDVPNNIKWRQRLSHCPIPLVGDLTDYVVDIDTADIINAAVQSLAEGGCRRIGLLSWNFPLESFHQAVKASGVITDNAWICNDIAAGARGAGWDGFREIWAAGLKPDGVVILDDMLFADAQLAMTELGLQIPSDLQVVVQTNRGVSPASHFPFTAMELNPEEKAALLTDLIMRTLRGEIIEKGRRVLPFRPVVMEAEMGVGRKSLTNQDARL